LPQEAPHLFIIAQPAQSVKRLLKKSQAIVMGTRKGGAKFAKKCGEKQRAGKRLKTACKWGTPRKQSVAVKRG
jgi:hypothetical protein